MQLKKEEDNDKPLDKGRWWAMVNLPMGCFSKLPPEFLTFGNNALNKAHPGFPN
jgi:hypothetical protein